jgi:hypothetical protein
MLEHYKVIRNSQREENNVSRPRVLLIEKCEDCPFVKYKKGNYGVFMNCTKTGKGGLTKGDIPNNCPLPLSDW